MIKIEGSGPLRSTTTVRRNERPGRSGSGSFASQLVSEPAAQGVSGGGTVNALDALLSLQEIDDSVMEDARAKARGEDLLDALEELRQYLLLGGIPREKLVQLADLVAGQRGRVSDPRLAGILDEIDLRAQVELAKYDAGAAG